MNRIFNILLACLLLAGCYDDKGNIDYRPLTEAQVTGIKDSYLLNLGDTWTVPVTVNFTKGEPAAVSYLWKVNGDTIAMTRDLSVVVSFPLRDNMVSEFVVTDEESGVRSIVPFQVSVQSEFSKGWMILSDAEDHSELSFLRASDDRFYANIYHDINKEYLSAGAFKLREHFLDPMDPATGSVAGQVFVACTGGAGYSVDLDGNSFSKVIATKDEFVGAMPADFKPQNYESIPSFAGQGVGCDYLISHGKLYTRLLYNGSYYQDGLYANFPSDFNDGNYQLKPWFIKGHELWGRYLVGFDEKSGSFVKFEVGEMAELEPGMDWGAGIPMARTGMNLIDGGMVRYFSDMSGDPDWFVLFMKDPDNAVQVIQLGIDPFGISMMGVFFYISDSQTPLLDEAGLPVYFTGGVINERSVFAFVGQGAQAYVATDNKLYAYNYGSKTMSLIRTYDRNITAIALSRTNCYELGIAFDQGDGTSGFSVADVSYLGAGKLIKEIQTVKGKVKDIVYKIGKIADIQGIQ